MIGGCTTIVLCSNKTRVEYKADTLFQVLQDHEAVGFYWVTAIFIRITVYVMSKFYKALREFEKDPKMLSL